MAQRRTRPHNGPLGGARSRGAGERPQPSAPVYNADIARVFDEIADLLELQRANPFRVRAYRRAAQTVGELDRSLSTLVARGDDLDALPGIGTDLAERIVEIVRTGRCALLEQLRAEVSPRLASLMKLPHLGPQRVRTLHDELGIETVQQLHAAAEAGQVHGVRGFGPRLEQEILEATRPHPEHAARVRLPVADEVAHSLLARLRALPGVERAEAAGSLRRRRDSIGDLDLLAQSSAGAEVIRAFVRFGGVDKVLAAGDTRASVVLSNGLQVDLRVVDRASFGAAWLYFTGSKAHNIALRRLAQERGLKLNEYGLLRGDAPVAGRDEASVYAALGLEPIAPELREDRGEIEVSRSGQLPHLIELSDLRGDLHAHTRDSDGRDDLEALVAAARAHGLEYLAVTDHSPRLPITHGLDARRLAQQIERIDRANERLRGFKVLKGIEVDILEDGRLDLPDAVLARLDLVVGAVHQHFDLSSERQTARLLKAMDHPHFSVLAHPTGRLIEERAGCVFDWPRVVRHARERGCFLELNAHPSRLDLDDVACRLARDEGVPVCISSDAHSALDLGNLRYGVDQARRGWLRRGDVLNARDWHTLRPLLARTM